MNPPDNIERSIEKLHITTTARTDRRILDDAFAALEESMQMQPPRIGARVRRTVVIGRIAKLAAVAAVILIAFALFFSTPTAKAVTLSQVYEALEKVKNVCISRLVPNKTKPIQKEWVSRTLNIRMSKTGEQFVLWDISNKVRKIRSLPSDSVAVTSMPQEMLAKVERSIAGALGLMPFSDITDVPEGAQWNRVGNQDIEATVPATEVYELTWIENGRFFYKWRVFVDRATNLPKRTEHYFKPTIEDEYVLESVEVVTYLTDNEIQALIENIFGRGAGQPSAPEYRGTPEPGRGGMLREE